ncbi:MAG: hydantoinase/oxoprolinase family protein, partial [Gammaproteobacteria bacterium]
LGCLLVDIRHDLATTYLIPAERADPTKIEAEFRALEREAVARLTAESVAPADMLLKRSIDMRYQGQWRTLTIPLVETFASPAAAVGAFHAQHEREFNYRRENAPVEIYRLNLTAIGLTRKPMPAEHPLEHGAQPAPIARRPVCYDEQDAPIDTPVYARHMLPAGCVLEGPAMIEQLDSTTLVPPGVRAEIDTCLNIRMIISGDVR